ncbi:MAG TPA: substrate-binding domain-containing protein, partial [Tepidisphaeraceae bacterium]
MQKRQLQIVLSTSMLLPDRAGLFRGVRRWLDRDPGLRVYVYPPLNEVQAASGRCDGFMTDLGGSTARVLSNARVPLVSLADFNNEENQYIVAFDERAIGRVAADHFLDQGHWQFAYVAYEGSTAGDGWQSQREEGFAQRLKEVGRSHATLNVEYLPRDPRSPHMPSRHDPVRQRAVAAFLKAQPKPLAVFAGDDALGVLVADACARGRLNVPADVAVLGVNNDPLCELAGPQLSSIAVPGEQVGYEATATLAALLRGARDVPRRRVFPPLGLVVRPSSDALQVRDPAVAKALRYIRDRQHEAVGVKELTAHVAVSRRSLERRFRDAVGRTPGEEIQRLREGLWRRLLVDTDLSMAEIAERCGFGTPASFATTIRRVEGV